MSQSTGSKMSMTLDERAIDVANMDNSASRWEQALHYYQETCAHIRSTRTSEKIRCVAIMDTSYSMDGKKLICVKLGLCSLLANFAADDEMNVIVFSSKITSVTGGFMAVSDLITIAPQFLHTMITDGCTACYDAIVEGVGTMRDRSSLCQSFATEASNTLFKNVALVLTDGEDNESIHTAKSVERLLVNPRMRHFMFLMVAVDMSKQWERKFRSWMDLNHCKQVRVNVKTGSSLVGVFKEMLLCRILQTESTSVRFLQENAVGDVADSGLSEEEFLALRAKQLREQIPTATDLPHPIARASGVAWVDRDDEEEEDGEGGDIMPYFHRNTSEGVSSVCSCSDGGDEDFDAWRHGGDFLSDSDDDNYDEDDNSLPLPVMQRHLTDQSSDSSCSNSSSSSDNSFVDLHSMENDKKIGDDHADNTSSINENRKNIYPSECYCPISHDIMTDPVICADGHTYERKHIQAWLSKNLTSPNTNVVLQHRRLVPNHSLRNVIQLLTNQNCVLQQPNNPHLPAISEI